MIKIIDYTIMADNEPLTLEQRIIKMLAEGWLPQGGVAVAVRPDGNTIYAQAMVKFEEGDDEG